MIHLVTDCKHTHKIFKLFSVGFSFCFFDLIFVKSVLRLHTHTCSHFMYVFRWINQPAHGFSFQSFCPIFSSLPLLPYQYQGAFFSMYTSKRNLNWIIFFFHLPIWTSKMNANTLEKSWTKTEIRKERKKADEWEKFRNRFISKINEDKTPFILKLEFISHWLDTCKNYTQTHTLTHEMPFQSTLHLNCILLTWEMVIKYDRINVMRKAKCCAEQHFTDRQNQI